MSITTLLAVNMLDLVEMVAMRMRGDGSKKGSISTGSTPGERLFPLIGQVYVFTLAAVGSGVYYGYVYAQIAAREIVTANPRLPYDPWVPVRTYLPYTLPVAATVGFLAVVLASALPCLTSRSGANARNPEAIKAAAAAAGFKGRFFTHSQGSAAAAAAAGGGGGGGGAAAPQAADAPVGAAGGDGGEGGGGGGDSEAEPLMAAGSRSSSSSGGGAAAPRLPRAGSGSAGGGGSNGASPHPFHALLAGGGGGGGSASTSSPLSGGVVVGGGGIGGGAARGGTPVAGQQPSGAAASASGVTPTVGLSLPSRRGLSGLGGRQLTGSAGAISTAAM